MNTQEVRSRLQELDSVRLAHESFGTLDTEPRNIIGAVLEAVMAGEKPKLPVTPSEWQIYEKEGETEVAGKLTHALSRVVEAIGETSVFESNSIGFKRLLESYGFSDERLLR